MREASVCLMTVASSTHLHTTAQSHPPSPWQKPIAALLIVHANLLPHVLAVVAEQWRHVHDMNHSLGADEDVDEPALPM